MAHDRSAHFARVFGLPFEWSGPVFMGPRLRGDDKGERYTASAMPSRPGSAAPSHTPSTMRMPCTPAK